MNLSDWLASQKALCDGASDLPWKLDDKSEPDWRSFEINGMEYFDSNGNDTNLVMRTDHRGNANFIASARTSLPLALRVIEQLNEALENIVSNERSQYAFRIHTRDLAQTALNDINTLISGEDDK